jgi:tetratricopeptide (TPR) repeat protein
MPKPDLTADTTAMQSETLKGAHRHCAPSDGPGTSTADGGRGDSLTPSAEPAHAAADRPPTREETASEGLVESRTAERWQDVEEALSDAEALRARGQAADAIKVLHRVLRLADETQSGRIRLELARTYLCDRNWQRNAVALLQELENDDHLGAEALALLGGLYRREGLLARAEAVLARAAARPSDGAGAAHAQLRAVRAARTERREADGRSGPARLVPRWLTSIGR